MRRRINSLLATVGFAVLSFAFPPLLIVSLASLALVTMRRGGQEGLIIALGGIVLLIAVSWSVAQQPVDLLVFAGLWYTIWVLALVYRIMSAPSWMMNTVGAMTVLNVAVFYLLVDSPKIFWMNVLERYVKPIFIERQLLQGNELDELMAALAQTLTGGVMAMFATILIVSVLLARWWQAALYNPGGFRREFYALRLGQITATVMLVLLLASMLWRYALLADMATALWVLFFFQGLAVAHCSAVIAGAGFAWIGGFYLLLVIVPNYAVPVIAGFGLVDTWMDFRRRLAAGRQSGN